MSKTVKRLTIEEFAQRIGKGREFVRALIKAGKIVVLDMRSPGSKVARYEIEETQVNQYLLSCRRRFDPAAQNDTKPTKRSKVLQRV
jgi:hypothetical protein